MRARVQGLADKQLHRALCVVEIVTLRLQLAYPIEQFPALAVRQIPGGLDLT